MREGWISDNFSNCIKLKSGIGLTAKNMIPGDFPVFGGNGIAGYHHEFNLTGEHIIVGRVGALCGNARYVKDKIWLTDNAFRISEFKYDFDLEFLNYLLNYIDLRTYARQAAQPVISNSSLKNVNLSFPRSISEQKQIVIILDQAFTTIDEAKTNIEKNIKNAKELFQSKLNEIFSQEDKGWEESKLHEIGVIQTGTTPPTKDQSNYGNFMPFIKPPHFCSDGSLQHKDSMLSEVGLGKGRLIKEQSILMVCIGATIGKTGFSTIPVSSNQQINALTPSNRHEPKLFYYALISPFVQNQVMAIGKSAQATLPIINKSKWGNLKVRFPSEKNVQTGIINMLDDLKLNTLTIEKFYRNKLSALEELKKSILQKAFAGELTGKELPVEVE